jgi:hypothetical protein
MHATMAAVSSPEVIFAFFLECWIVAAEAFGSSYLCIRINTKACWEMYCFPTLSLHVASSLQIQMSSSLGVSALATPGTVATKPP